MARSVYSIRGCRLAGEPGCGLGRARAVWHPRHRAGGPSGSSGTRAAAANLRTARRIREVFHELSAQHRRSPVVARERLEQQHGPERFRSIPLVPVPHRPLLGAGARFQRGRRRHQLQPVPLADGDRGPQLVSQGRLSRGQCHRWVQGRRSTVPTDAKLDYVTVTIQCEKYSKVWGEASLASKRN